MTEHENGLVPQEILPIGTVLTFKGLFDDEKGVVEKYNIYGEPSEIELVIKMEEKLTGYRKRQFKHIPEQIRSIEVGEIIKTEIPSYAINFRKDSTESPLKSFPMGTKLKTTLNQFVVEVKGCQDGMLRIFHSFKFKDGQTKNIDLGLIRPEEIIWYDVKSIKKRSG